MNVCRQKGSSLLEVLVSLFVLAIGLMGILAMQVKAMQFSMSADTYARAMNIANDIAERIRVNPKSVAAYASTTLPENAPTSCQASSLSAAVCTAEDLVKWDLFNWNQNIKNSLPSGAGSISTKTQGSEIYVQIIVSFDDSRSNGGTTTTRKQYTLPIERPSALGGA